MPQINELSAVTLATSDMAKAVAFYTALGFDLKSGGADQSFCSFRVGPVSLNLALRPGYSPGPPWGRLVFWVEDVDELYALALIVGLSPSGAPRDAEWGERYFHVLDPDGHELSFAKPLPRKA